MSTHAAAHHDHHQQETNNRLVLGFWLYIMSDCLIFASLFATFAVLHDNTYIAFSIKNFTDLPYVLSETLFLLASSFTYGMAVLSLYKNHRNKVISWLIVTFILGISFVIMEVNEFVHLIAEAHGPDSSAAMSAFFTLVGTHGFHVSMGLFWMLVMIVQLFVFGTSDNIKRRLTYLGLFWAFLDIVWIFVFSIVYLMGAI